MSFVGEGFEFDVFISHSHGGQKGKGTLWLEWSKKFHAEFSALLENRNATFRDEPEKVFFDRSPRPGEGLDPLDSLTDGLERSVRSSATLLTLMSPQYLWSKWCQKEREWWVAEQAQRKLTTNRRAIVVRIQPTDGQEVPQVLADPRGFYFYDETTDPQDSWPYGFLDPEERITRRVWEVVRWVRSRLREFAQELKVHKEGEAALENLRAPRGQRIYLHARPEHREVWSEASAILVKQGFIVGPEGGPPAPARSFLERRTAIEKRVGEMAASDAVLIVGTEDTNALLDDVEAIGLEDLQSARARSNRPLPGGVLIFAAGAILHEAESDLAWIDATDPAWPDKVREWLKTTAK